jgi:hypothetical protein
MVGERVPGGSLPDDPRDAEGFPLMTHEVVARMARETDGYMLPEVNDILWLSDKRWRAVAGLDAFTGVTILHLENNRIGPTLGDGLQAMRKLAVLHLNGNSLTSVDDARLARRHPSLVSVSLAGNRISRVSNDAFPNSLRTLSLAKNRLRDASAIEALSRLPDLETLDLGENELRDEDEDVLKVLAECPSLRALTLRGNPLQHSLGLDYRRALVSALPSLTCLDDKAVSAMERLGAEAWRRGGKSKQAEKEAKESLVFARDERRRAATRAAAAERAERRAKAEARQAEERDVAGASDERSNSGEAAKSHVEDVSAPRASELTEKTRDPIAAAAAAAAAAVAEGDRRLAEEAKTRRRAFALAAARGEEVTFAPSPVEMSAEATQQTLRVELSKLGLVSRDETEESPDLPSEAATRAAALFREMVETRRAQRA